MSSNKAAIGARVAVIQIKYRKKSKNLLFCSYLSIALELLYSDSYRMKKGS
ncbi:hypothetical protein ACFP3I_13890 [Chryseobacterium arachidis]|uniref:hypothetical protein n=1 Tax=Chryseobacterium arachidis TaxID=1416778 RepID=UPI00362011DD